MIEPKPNNPDEDVSDRLSVRLDDEMAEALHRMHIRKRRSKASLAKEALLELLEHEGFLKFETSGRSVSQPSTQEAGQ